MRLWRTQADYARYANIVRRGYGHLWQARFYSCPLDGTATWQAMAYVERNPVRAGVVANAEAYAWSSARIHCGGADADGRLELSAWRRMYTPERWRSVLGSSVGEEAFEERIRQATSVGLPLGQDEFVESLGHALGRDLRHKPPGRPPKRCADAAGEMG